METKVETLPFSFHKFFWKQIGNLETQFLFQFPIFSPLISGLLRRIGNWKLSFTHTPHTPYGKTGSQEPRLPLKNLHARVFCFQFPLVHFLTFIHWSF